MKKVKLQDEDAKIFASIIYNLRHYLINYASGLSITPKEYMTDELNGRLLMAKDTLKYLMQLEDEHKIFI